jgi:hypothetical protein
MENDILSESEELEILRKSVNTLKECKKIQCIDGNWNYDPYMLGMANGLIFALSLFEKNVNGVEYLSTPDEWLRDKQSNSPPEYIIESESNNIGC